MVMAAMAAMVGPDDIDENYDEMNDTNTNCYEKTSENERHS